MPKWIRRFLSDQYNASCKLHDIDYDRQLHSRKECDKRFLTHMKRQANRKAGLKRILWLFMAYIFYIGVRVGGKASWKQGEDNDV